MRASGRALLAASARWETLLVVFILIAGLWSSTLSPFFLHRANLLDLVTPYVFLGLMAFGLTFVVVAGEIDISVASTLSVTGVSFAQLWHSGSSWREQQCPPLLWPYRLQQVPRCR